MYAVEVLRRMLKPHGWKVETVYFDSRLTYHIDCLVSLLEEGLMAYPKGSLWTELPEKYRAVRLDPNSSPSASISTGSPATPWPPTRAASTPGLAV